MKDIKLELINEGDFLGTKCDFYRDDKNNIYMTRKQIGSALQYKNPEDALYRIHERNQERLEQYSFQLKMEVADGKKYKTRLYTEQGIWEVIRLSQQPTEYKVDLLKALGYNSSLINTIVYSSKDLFRHQNLLYSILVHTYYDLNIEREIRVDKYRVDFLINNKIIVECDEFGHMYRDKKYELKRENYLKSCGYIVLRYNPNSEKNNKEQSLISNINYALNKEYKLINNNKNSVNGGFEHIIATRKYGAYVRDVDLFIETYKEYIPLERKDSLKKILCKAKREQDTLLSKNVLIVSKACHG